MKILKTFLSLVALSAFSWLEAETLVSTLPGDVVVDNTGSATYSIPLSVSPGTGGMQPDLSLQYSSRGGNGILGVGWSLGGLSAISRAPATHVHDGFVDGVDFDNKDRFSLDGQRLIDVAGTYGANGSEYRTELESFSRIKAYGQINGRGPQYFKVWTKAGLIMTYGDGGSVTNNKASQIPENSPGNAVLTWSISRIEDTSGNYMDFVYDLSSNGEHTLRFIRYTGNVNTGLATYNEVEFVYKNRSSISSQDHGRFSYVSGAKITSTKLLD